MRPAASTASSELPSDLDILRPFSSIVRPWLITLLNGAVPRSDTAQTSDELNHPRACSTASRYASAGHFSSGRTASTAACDDPESNQTSRMSSCLTKLATPHFVHLTPGATKSAAGRLYHASEPSRAKISSTRSIVAVNDATSAQSAHLTAGIGTPHARWREMHQSGRVSVMLRIRSRDQAGYHFTLSIASITLPRRP